MSIAQQIMSNPGRYSIEELQQALDAGVVPAYIAIPLIQEKTQQQQQMQMASMAQGAPQEMQPSVAEQVLAQAGQAPGIDELQTNLPPQGFAPGGIVAFEDGGQIPGYARGTLTEEEDEEEKTELDTTPAGLLSLLAKSQSGMGGAPDLKSAVEAIRGTRAPTDDTATKAIKDYIARQGETSEDRARQQRAFRFLEMAGRMAGGRSPFGLVNVGEAVAGTAPGMAEDERSQERQQLQNLMLQSQLEQQRRAEESADITGGISLFGHQADLSGRQAAAQSRLGSAIAKLAAPPKDTDFRTSVKNKVDEFRTKMKLGLIPTPTDKSGNPLAGEQLETIIRGMATDEAMKLRQQAQVYGANVGLEGTLAGLGSRQTIEDLNRRQRESEARDRRWNNSMDAVGKEMGSARTTISKTSRKLATDFGDDAALTYQENERRRRFNSGLPESEQMPLLEEWWKSGKPGDQPAAAKPAAVTPKASVLIAPPAAIDYLKKNNTPAMRKDFDAKYGQGAAARALGG